MTLDAKTLQALKDDAWKRATNKGTK